MRPRALEVTVATPGLAAVGTAAAASGGTGGTLWVGGVALPRALADLGLIDEYELLVHPVVAGHGPRLLDGLGERVRLELVDRHELASGVAAQRYRSVV